MPDIITSTVGTAPSDYTTLELWEVGQFGNLVSSDTIERAAMFNEVLPGTLNLTEGGWVTDATRYIHIDADAGAEHDGTIGSGARLITSSGTALNVGGGADDVLFSDIEISSSGPGSNNRGIFAQSNGVVNVDRCIIHGWSASGGRGIDVTGTGVTNVTNTLLFDCAGWGLLFQGGVQTHTVYNTTIWCDDAAADGIMIIGVSDGSEKDVDLRNCLIHGGANCIDASFTTVNKWNASCDQNILSDGTGSTQNLPGTLIESATFQEGTGGSGTRVMFESLSASAGEDLRLVLPGDPSENEALDFGNNLTTVILPAGMDMTLDIEAALRQFSGSWDGGCHQLTVGVTKDQILRRLHNTLVRM